MRINTDLRNWAVGGAVICGVAAPILKAKQGDLDSLGKFATVTAGAATFGAFAGSLLCFEGGAEILRALRR
jgi:hypothetical protein